MDMEKLEKQVLLWSRAAILVPIFFTALLGASWWIQITDLETLFFVACGLYFTTAIVWWWWTMQSIRLLVRTLSSTSQSVSDVADELKSIRKELQVDNNNGK